MDAIHLATARRLGVQEFHTYDEKLLKYQGDLGFPIREPIAAAPELPFPVEPHKRPPWEVDAWPAEWANNPTQQPPPPPPRRIIF